MRVYQADGKYRALFDWLIERVEAGEFVEALFKQRGIDGQTFRRFLRRNPDFSERYYAAMGRRPRQSGGGIRYAETHYSEALALFSAKISIRSERFKPEGLPSYNAMLKRSYRDPDFAAEWAGCRRKRISAKCLAGISAHRCKSAKAKAPKPVLQTAQLRGQLLQDSLYAAADKAVNRGLDPQTRDDVMMDIIEAVLDGTLAFDDIGSKAKEYTAAHFRRTSSHKIKSLDQTVFDDGGMTFVDRLTTDDYSYAD